MDEPQQRIVQPGDFARNFSLKDQNDRTFDLLEQMGRKVLLSFPSPGLDRVLCHPDGIAGGEQGDLHNAQTRFRSGSVLIPCPGSGKGPASPASPGRRLLCDFWPHGRVARSYGLFREQNGSSERANVILDQKNGGHLRQGLPCPQRTGYRRSDTVFGRNGEFERLITS